MPESTRVGFDVESDVGAIGDGSQTRPIPILTPEQYRFLRFLFRVADDPEVEEIDGRWVRGPLHDRRQRRALSRMRSALSLFELRTASQDDGAANKQHR